MCAKKIVGQKRDMPNKMPSHLYKGKGILAKFFPRAESVDEWILRGMIQEFKVVQQAIQLVEEVATEEFIKYGRKFNP